MEDKAVAEEDKAVAEAEEDKAEAEAEADKAKEEEEEKDKEEENASRRRRTRWARVRQGMRGGGSGAEGGDSVGVMEVENAWQRKRRRMETARERGRSVAASEKKAQSARRPPWAPRP